MDDDDVYTFSLLRLLLLLIFETFICIRTRVLELHTCTRFTLCSPMEVARLHTFMCASMIDDQQLAHSPITFVLHAPNAASKRNCKSRDAILKRSWSHKHTHTATFMMKIIFKPARKWPYYTAAFEFHCFGSFSLAKLLQKG